MDMKARGEYLEDQARIERLEAEVAALKLQYAAIGKALLTFFGETMVELVGQFAGLEIKIPAIPGAPELTIKDAEGEATEIPDAIYKKLVKAGFKTEVEVRGASDYMIRMAGLTDDENEKLKEIFSLADEASRIEKP